MSLLSSSVGISSSSARPRMEPFATNAFHTNDIIAKLKIGKRVHIILCTSSSLQELQLLMFASPSLTLPSPISVTIREYTDDL